MAKKNIKISKLRASYPDYFISKNKIKLTENTNVKQLYEKVIKAYSQYDILTIDGVKIDFPDGWVQLRTSNTEPIMRIYAESDTPEKARNYAQEVMSLLK